MSAQSATSILLRHWLEVGGSTLPPNRMAIDPARIAPVLEWTLTLNVPEMTIRVRGSKIETWLGSNWNGRLHDGFDPLDHEAISLMGPLLGRGRRVRRTIVFSDGTSGAILLLPLKLHFGGICRAVGAIDYPSPLPAGAARITHGDHLRLVYSRESA